MDTYNSKYYEPFEQMMAIRHQYMSKILRDHSGQDIYEFFKNKKILDLGCGTCSHSIILSKYSILIGSSLLTG